MREPETPTPCKDCGVDLISDAREYAYMLTDASWALTGLAPDGGYLCVGCCELRLGRTLVMRDFDWNVPLTGVQYDQVRSARLRARMESTVPEALAW